MPGKTVDGMELDQVREAASEAVDLARSGGGPTLIEAITYRYLGHSKSDANLYRTRDEISEWRERDPIGRFATRLEEEGAIEQDAWRELEQRTRERVEAAFEKAAQEPEPEPETALEDVYA
jgi:acetoin:2,6-dichlorophenolindophenol oxidoreductase subunit alpha